MTDWGANFDRDLEANVEGGWHIEGQIIGHTEGKREMWVATAGHPAHGNVAAFGYNPNAALDNLRLILDGDEASLELGNRTYIKYLSWRGWTAGWGRRK